MSRGEPVVDRDTDVREFAIFQDEKACRLWIECLENNLMQARSLLEKIIGDKTASSSEGDMNSCADRWSKLSEVEVCLQIFLGCMDD